MQIISGRFWVRLISADALAQYMEHRDFTVRKLADKIGVSHGVVGHLRSGHRNTCKPETAKAIEKALGAPPASLFVPQVTPIARAGRRAA